MKYHETLIREAATYANSTGRSTKPLLLHLNTRTSPKFLALLAAVVGLTFTNLRVQHVNKSPGHDSGAEKNSEPIKLCVFLTRKIVLSKRAFDLWHLWFLGGPSPRLKVAPSSLPKSTVCPSRSFGIPSSSRAAATRPGPSIGLSAPDSACKAKSKETWAAILCWLVFDMGDFTSLLHNSITCGVWDEK